MRNNHCAYGHNQGILVKGTNIIREVPGRVKNLGLLNESHFWFSKDYPAYVCPKAF